MVSKNRAGFVLAALLLALFASVGMSGCGGGVVASVCDVVCFCQQCSEEDRAACEDAGDKSKALSSEHGCSSQFSVYTACLQDQKQVHCEGTHATTENCAAELTVLKKCTQQDMQPFGSSGGPGGG